MTNRPTRIEEALSLAESLANPVRSTEDTGSQPNDVAEDQKRTMVQARGVETHERGKSVRRRRRRERMFQKQRREAHGLLAELGTHGGLGGRAVVAFVEEQVKCALDGWKAPGKVIGARYIEQPLRSRQHFLGPRDALLDRSVTAHERIRHFIYAKPAQDVQHESDLSFLRKPRSSTRT